MKDRVVQYPARYQLVPVAGTTDTFDLVAVPGTVTEAGTDLNKSALLKDATAALFGLTGTAVPDDVLSITGQRLSGKNLLDNWDFRNPVNQRGLSSYTASVGEIYTVDRWILRASGTLSIDSSGVTITPSGSCDIVQKLENETILTGEIATLSVDVDGTIYSVTFEIGNAGSGVSVLSGCALFSISGYPVLLRFSSAVTIRRIKLELGSVSTLANDPPADYAIEFAKCVQYDLSTGSFVGPLSVAAGTYTGDGATSRTINIGTTPDVVLVWPKSAGRQFLVLKDAENSIAVGAGFSDNNTTYKITTNGFIVGTSDVSGSANANSTNWNAESYGYAAFIA